MESNVARRSLPASELVLEYPGWERTLDDDAALPERDVARIGGGNSFCCSLGGVLLLRTGSGAENPCFKGDR
jgi:hypothetical protein